MIRLILQHQILLVVLSQVASRKLRFRIKDKKKGIRKFNWMRMEIPFNKYRLIKMVIHSNKKYRLIRMEIPSKFSSIQMEIQYNIPHTTQMVTLSNTTLMAIEYNILHTTQMVTLSHTTLTVTSSNTTLMAIEYNILHTTQMVTLSITTLTVTLSNSTLMETLSLSKCNKLYQILSNRPIIVKIIIN